MSSVLALPLSVVLESLEQRARDQLSRRSPETAFAMSFLGPDVPGAIGASATTDGDEEDQIQRGESPSLAIEGYRLWRLKSESPFGAPAPWVRGMERLSKRDPFAIDRQTFVFRPYELVGIAAGVARTGTQSEWLRDVVSKLGNQGALTTRQQLLTGMAVSLLRLPPTKTILVEAPTASLGELALAMWLSSSFEISVRVDGLGAGEDPNHVLLRRAIVEPACQTDGAESLILASLLRSVVMIAADQLATSAGNLGLRTRAAVSDVVSICRRFEIVARQLRHRHDSRGSLEITDEYDVQDLLHALLLSRFEDVRPEEWTPSYAGSSARTDFLLKQEEVFIEAKKTRKTLRDRDVAEQLAVDVGFYRQHPNCRALVCFVYDPDRLLRNPAALESDLSGVREGLSIHVVVCPKGS